MKKLREDCGGFTLVEIIVTFALTALFMGSATLVMSSFVKSHTTASAVAREQAVATVLMENVTGGLSAARWGDRFDIDSLPDGSAAGTAGAAENARLVLTNDANGSVVWYVDWESKSKVKLCLDNDYLLWTYYPEPDADGNAPDPVEWRLGENVYNNCTVKEFTVGRVLSKTGRQTNCLNVRIVLNNKQLGEDNRFTMERSLECHNLTADDILPS